MDFLFFLFRVQKEIILNNYYQKTETNQIKSVEK
jgi:hypothetical protein